MNARASLPRSRQTPRRLALSLLVGVALLLAAAHSADRNALADIVSACVRHWQQAHQATPCLRLHLPRDRQVGDGYALLHDQKGGAHFLLIPTRRLAGIEDPALLQSGSPNYFAAAWEARALLTMQLDRPIERNRIGLAVNAPYSRGQDQLHIHIECIGTPLAQTLQAAAGQLGASWVPLRVGIWRYQARRVLGAGLRNADPFKLLADGLPGARLHMGAYTLVVAGWQFAEGPGFVVLAGSEVPGGEHLLGSDCPPAKSSP